jgi:hypothetical protein
MFPPLRAKYPNLILLAGYRLVASLVDDLVEAER